MERKILIDGGALAHYTFFSELTTAQGFYEELSKIPDSDIFICMDSKPYWRSMVYPAYKANRGEKPEGFEDHMLDVYEQGTPYGTLLALECMEADDIIAAMAREHERCMIVSVDSDLKQLCDPQRRIIFRDIRTGEYTVEDNYRGIVLVKALAGDKSDNIPGIRRGVGPVTARKIIEDGMQLSPQEWVKFTRNLILIDLKGDLRDEFTL